MNGTRKPRGCRCKVGLRRVSPVAVRSGDRLLSEPSADTQPCQREPLFMPHSGHSSPLLRGQGCPLSGWEQSFVSRQLFGCANCRGGQVQQRPCTETGSTRLPRQPWQAANASAGSTAASAPCSECQRRWHALGLWTWRPSCLPAPNAQRSSPSGKSPPRSVTQPLTMTQHSSEASERRGRAKSHQRPQFLRRCRDLNRAGPDWP